MAARCCSVLPTADALVNVTNDAWFGHSSARHQHLQISRMRATGGRPLHGAGRQRRHLGGDRARTAKSSPALRNSSPAVLVSQIVPMKGLTPYARVGN